MTRSIRKRQKQLRKKSTNKTGHAQSESYQPRELRRKAERKLSPLGPDYYDKV